MKKGKYRTGEEDNCLHSAYLVTSLKNCAKYNDLRTGAILHAVILEHGLLGKNSFVDSTLVSMYAKCGALMKAHELLDVLPVRDMVSWSAMIAGYSQDEHGEEALDCFQRMQQEGLSPNAVTYICILKACGSIGALDKGEHVHFEIATQGLLGRDAVLGGALVDMYAKCGALARAKEVLEWLPARDVSSWNVLITAYVQENNCHQALACLKRIYCEGISPNMVTFLCILKACGNIKALDKGRNIHSEILMRGLLSGNVVLGNALVDMYAKCGVLGEAKAVLEKLQARDVISWSSLIAGYVQGGYGNEALKCYKQMQCDGFSPNAITFTCILKACGSIGALDKGKEIHIELVKQGLLGLNLALGGALVDMYSRCNALGIAKEVLDGLPVREVFSWSALIAGYVQEECPKEAVACFEEMQCEGLFPTAVTFACILKACGRLGALGKGKEVHSTTVMLGCLDANIVLGSALVDMYAKCGALVDAKKVIGGLHIRDVVLWNTLIAGYAQGEHAEEALICLEQMQSENIIPDAVTFLCSLKACTSIGALDRVQGIHVEIVRQGWLNENVELGGALVDIYSKCDALTKAKKVLEGLPVRDAISWNALIAGLVHGERYEEALKCFIHMQHERLTPDAVTLICILKACGNIGALQKGEIIHSEIVSQGLLDVNVPLGDSLIEMYAKCGAFGKAKEVLEGLVYRNTVSWNSLLAGYAQGQHGKEALNCIECMQRESLLPDEITCTYVLSACSHSGLLGEGQNYFSKMSTHYGLQPNLKHHTCMVNLFGNVGLFVKVVTVIDKMLPFNDLPAWFTLLNSCRKWGNLNLGTWAFEHAMKSMKVGQ